eukprot:3553902-Amphidinium_carterae.1
MQKEWDFYLDAVKHMQEVDKGVASYAVSPTPFALLKSSTKLGRRRAHRGSGPGRLTCNESQPPSIFSAGVVCSQGTKNAFH